MNFSKTKKTKKSKIVQNFKKSNNQKQIQMNLFKSSELENQKYPQQLTEEKSKMFDVSNLPKKYDISEISTITKNPLVYSDVTNPMDNSDNTNDMGFSEMSDMRENSRMTFNSDFNQESNL